MKAKITKGKNFKTIINYVFSPGEKNKKDRADWVGGTLGSNSPQEIIKDFDTVQRLRPHIEKPSWHCSLTLPEGEYLSDGEWEDIVEDFMEKMEFSKLTPYTIVRHNDTEFDHVHVIASRVPMKGPVWTGKNDVYKAIAATQELEEKYNLTRTPGYRKRESARETYRERKKAERTGVTPPRIQLQELIDRAVVDKPTAPQFAQRLEDAGVVVRANLASTGKMNGFSFELDGLAFKGSKLGKAYGWSGLQKRGVSYDVETDAAELERYKLPVAERHSHQEDETLPEPSSETPTGNQPNIATADTEETSEEPQAEKMLKALEGYYQSQIDKNDETVETSRQEDLAEIYQIPTAPTTTYTDSTEAARLETVLNAFEEIFNHSVAQGQSKTESEEFPFEAAPKEETEAAPEITTPETTQPPIDKCALSETPQELNQQQQWVESLMPDLAQFLIDARTLELETETHILAWDKEQQRLTLRKNESQENILDAKWKEEGWQDNGSNLTDSQFEQLRQALDRRNRERERELQKQRISGGFELG